MDSEAWRGYVTCPKSQSLVCVRFNTKPMLLNSVILFPPLVTGGWYWNLALSKQHTQVLLPRPPLPSSSAMLVLIHPSFPSSGPPPSGSLPWLCVPSHYLQDLSAPTHPFGQDQQLRLWSSCSSLDFFLSQPWSHCREATALLLFQTTGPSKA